MTAPAPARDELPSQRWDALITFLDALPHGAWIARRGLLVAVNRALCEALGRTVDELRGLPPHIIATPADRRRVAVANAAARRWKRPSRVTFRLNAKESPKRTVEQLTAWLPGASGDELLGATFDIEEHMQREHELERIVRWVRTLLDRTSDVIFVLDREGRFQWCNAAVRELLGYEPDELVGTPVMDLVPPEHREAAVAQWERLANGNISSIRGKLTARARDGRRLVVDVVAWPVVDDGDISGYQAIARDITDSVVMEQALRRSSAEIQSILDALPSVLIVVGPDCRVRLWNRTAEELFGRPRAAILNQALPLDELLHEGADQVRMALEACLGGEPPKRLQDVRFQRPSGQLGVLGITVAPLRGNGSVSGAVMIGADVTHRRLLERELARAQKLEAIGQLAAGIAHEINTPTQFVGDNIRFLGEVVQALRQLAVIARDIVATLRTEGIDRAEFAAFDELWQRSDVDFLVEEAPQAVLQALDGISRVTRIVQAMRAFSHPGGEEKQLTDLNNAIRSTVTVARNEWKYHSDLILELDDNLPMVPVIPSDFNQVILNLVVNAAHAVSDKVKDSGKKGTIRISTRQETDEVVIEVTDTGCGIPEEIRDKVFDPFFTTKPPGRGTGQGLAICHAAVVERHGGSITFTSEVGVGTTFIVRLPINGGRP